MLGGTGKKGRRIAARHDEKGVPIRIGSRSASPPFDWNNEAGWDACLKDATSVYINYAPDLAVPGAIDSLQASVHRAKRHGVKRLVRLSGRGEAKAQACERIVQQTGLDLWMLMTSQMSPSPR